MSWVNHDFKTDCLTIDLSRVELSKRLMIFKRTLDIIIGGSLIILALPVLILCILMIKLANPGPAFYSQWRVGKNGWLFRIYKLRTMKQHAERHCGVITASQGDDRIIRCCRWMRQSHIDELPQLLNIVRGEMSLVGPRPERPEIHENLQKKLPSFEYRLLVKPGLTGLAQVRNGYTNDLQGHKRKLRMDLSYINKTTWANELVLLCQTLPMFWDRRAI